MLHVEQAHITITSRLSASQTADHAATAACCFYDKDTHVQLCTICSLFTWMSRRTPIMQLHDLCRPAGSVTISRVSLAAVPVW